MSGHRVLYDLLNAPYEVLDPGAGKALVVDRDRVVFPIKTAAAETRTLAAPTKAGLMCTIAFKTDGGDCTITVASAFTESGETTITLANAGECITLVSVPNGSSYAWRVVSRQGLPALTAKDASTVDATYGAEEVAVIGNNRTRIEEIENALKKAGILQ